MKNREKKSTAVEYLFRRYMDKKMVLTQADFEKAIKLEEEQLKHAATWGGLYEDSDRYYQETWER